MLFVKLMYLLFMVEKNCNNQNEHFTLFNVSFDDDAHFISSKVFKELNGWLSCFIWSKRKPKLKMNKLRLSSHRGDSKYKMVSTGVSASFCGGMVEE